MKNILKKLSLPAYLFPLSAVLALIGLIVAVVSCSGEGFGMKEMPLVVSQALVFKAYLSYSSPLGSGSGIYPC